MLGIFSERFAVFMSFFFYRDIISLNVNFYFERNDNFTDLLPITGDVNYIDTKNDLSVFQCAGSCVFCAGFLYNSGSRTCHLLKGLFNESSFNRSRVDIGWELYESLNVCGLGWHLYRTHCYTYLELKKTRAEAKDYCASTGAYLVQIDTRDENEWIKETLQPPLNGSETCSNMFCCDSWIGASDQDKEDVFQWTNKENVVFSNWISGQPDNYGGGEDCVALCLNGQWNDYPCTYHLNTICEKDIIFS